MTEDSKLTGQPTYTDLVMFAKWCERFQPNAVEIMRLHGYAFTDLDDPWQKLAFTFYSDLCEIHVKVENLFEEELISPIGVGPLTHMEE